MKIKAYFPKTFTIMADEVERLEKQIRDKFELPKEHEVTEEDLLIEADSEGLIQMPNPTDFKV